MALWLKLLPLIVVALLVIGTGTIAYGALVLAAWHPYAASAAAERAPPPITPTAYDAREIEGLPAPVQRYFRAVLQAGQPMVAAVQLRCMQGSSTRARRRRSGAGSPPRSDCHGEVRPIGTGASAWDRACACSSMTPMWFMRRPV